MKDVHYISSFEVYLVLGMGFILGRLEKGSWGWQLALVVGLVIVWYRWRSYLALDQWPDPHGRYYREWLKAKNVGDYYPWLAAKMGNREPWAMWARYEPQGDDFDEDEDESTR